MTDQGYLERDDPRTRDRGDAAGAAGTPAPEDATAAHADPDDLGSTSPDSGLTAGGTGTSIDEDLVADVAGDGADAGGFTDPEALGMGMDDTSGYLEESEEDTPA